MKLAIAGLLILFVSRYNAVRNVPPPLSPPRSFFARAVSATSTTNTAAAVAAVAAALLMPLQPSWAGMLIFPLPAPLKNNIVLVRSGESYADQEHRVETNPVKKLQQNNGLTAKGREDMHAVANKLAELDFSPSFIWTSNTERAYESARVLAEDLQLGQNRVVPEYSFLDARAMGTFENTNDAAAWEEVHKQDELQGGKYRPPPANDGTPSESVSDVLVRANQVRTLPLLACADC